MMLKSIPMLKPFSLKIALLLLLGLSQSALAAVDCSPESIQFYLDKGFSQEQVVRLCVEEPASKPEVSVEAAPVMSQPQENSAHLLTRSQQDDLVFINTAIPSSNITFSPQQLTYIMEECITIGDSETFVYNDKYCATIKTEIKLPGMEIVKTQKGNLFLDTIFLVKTDIKRSIVNPQALKAKTLKVFNEQMETNPQEFDIPLRSDADPEQLAKRLIKYQ